MTSAPVRDPLADHLITLENAAFLFIDYQPAQLAAVRSMDHALLVKNAVSTVRTIPGSPITTSARLLPRANRLERLVQHAAFSVPAGQLRRASWDREMCRHLIGTDVTCPRLAAPTGHWRMRAGPGRPDAYLKPVRRAADQVGLARLRAAARLGPPGDSPGDRRDRPDRPTQLKE